MNKARKNAFGCAANFLRGKECVWCGSFKVSRAVRGYVKCHVCTKQNSLKKIHMEIAIVTGFYQQQPAYRLHHRRCLTIFFGQDAVQIDIGQTRNGGAHLKLPQA